MEGDPKALKEEDGTLRGKVSVMAVISKRLDDRRHFLKYTTSIVLQVVI